MAGRGGVKVSDAGMEKCVDCKKDLNTNKTRSISCDFCHNWYCFSCSKIKTSLFTELSKVTDMSLIWNCPHCRIALPGIKDLITRVLSLEAKVESLSKQKEKEPSVDLNAASVKEIFRQQKQEEEDIESRKLNLVVHSFKESKKASQDERKADDTQNLNNLINDTLSSDVEVENVIRLGKPRDDNKPRPLRFTVRNFEAKRKVLNEAKVLKNHTRFSCVYLTPDLTANQRHDAFKLREEKRRREKNGERNLIIRRGKIITKTVNNDHTYGRDEGEGRVERRGSDSQALDRRGQGSNFH